MYIYIYNYVYIFYTFRPSTSKSEGLNDYERAEKYGKEKRHCKKFAKDCSISFLGLISFVGKLF